MYEFLSTKGRADARELIVGQMKILALPPAMVLIFAGLLAALATANGLSGVGIAWGFIAETVEPVATVMGAVLLSAYVGAVVLYVLPSFHNGWPLTGRALVRPLSVIVRWISRSVVPWRTIQPSASTIPGLLFCLPSSRFIGCEAGPYFEGQHPQRE